METVHRSKAGEGLAAALRAGILVLAGAMAMGGIQGFAQVEGAPPMLPPANGPKVFPGPMSPKPLDPALAKIEHRQALARNVQRQKDLEKDTDKLFDLAKELKAAVDKSNKDTLSIQVIKKADEIQKLAKSISSKMKGE